MSLIAGIDYSTHAVDVVLLDEDSDRAEWHRFELHGQDAFERARDVRRSLLGFPERVTHGRHCSCTACGQEDWTRITSPCGMHGPSCPAVYAPHGSVLAIGIEEPRGYNSGALYRVQGAVLACLPRQVLVQPWLPSGWRKAVGLSGAASKGAVADFVDERGASEFRPGEFWPQDACDAYCIALATRQALQKEEAA